LHWWPADTAFEVIIGAILTQNTAWRNVALAITNLKAAGVITPAGVNALAPDKLAQLIKPSGYYNIKAQRLQAFTRFLQDEFSGSMDALAAGDLEELRGKLLRVRGIGPETADSILLYACEKPIFVVDAYTKRILSRHGIVPTTADYAALQNLFMKNLPPRVGLYNQYHALLVNTGKIFCTPKQEHCGDCPLHNMPDHS